jgi:hypothetical protein
MTFCLRTNKEHKMAGNPRDMIAVAGRRFPVRISFAVPPGGFGQQHSQNYGLARPELRRRWLGNDNVRNARGAQRRRFDLSPWMPPSRAPSLVVCRLQGRDRGGRVQSAN